MPILVAVPRSTACAHGPRSCCGPAEPPLSTADAPADSLVNACSSAAARSCVLRPASGDFAALHITGGGQPGAQRPGLAARASSARGAAAPRRAWGAGAQVAPQNWRRSGPPPAPQGTCTFVLFDDKAGSGVSLGTVAVWPPTQAPQLDKEAGVCMLQLTQSIPAGSYSVRPRPSPTPPLPGPCRRPILPEDF